MNPVRFAVERPYTVAVAVILALLFSALAFRDIPVQLKPTVEPPVIQVRTLYPGAGPVEVEEQVTRRIEDLLQGVDGLDRLTSSSLEGQSLVTLEYEWGVDKDRAVVDVTNKLRELAGLPQEAEQPVVSLTGEMGENNSMWIVARSHYSPSRIRQIVVEHVEPRLLRVPGVAELLIVGGAEREIRIFLDPELLAGRRLSFESVASAVRRGFQDLRGGTVESGPRQLVVRTEGRSEDLGHLESLVLRRDDQGTVRLRDVARVADATEEITSIVHSEQGPTVAIGVARQSGANVVRMIEGVDRELEALNREFADRGLDLRLVPVHKDTTYLERAMGFVQANLLLGAGLAVAVLLLFLRSLRSVLIVSVSIPISLITVFLVMDALGRSLNVISLAGLAFAAGLVVDNAIVVLENIFRHLERGRPAQEASVTGGREVWGGILAATLTTIAVFLPVVGIQEEAGQLFADLAIAISAAVGLSLIVALTVIPCLTALLYRRRPPVREGGGGGRIYAFLLRGLVLPGAGPLLWRLALFTGVAALLVWSLRQVPPAGYLPTGNRNLILFFGSPVPGSRPEALEENLRPLEEWLLRQPEVRRFFLVVASQFNGGGVVLHEKEADGPGLAAFQQRFLPVCMGLTGFRSMFPFQASLFRDSGKQFTLEITGPELETLERTAAGLQARLRGIPGVARVESDYVAGRPEIHVEADRERAAQAGLGVEEIGRLVETAVAGRRLGTFSQGGRDYDLVLVAPRERVQAEEDLLQLPIVTPAGLRTTLGSVARVRSASGPQSVNRIERQRAITLTVNLEPDAVLEEVLSRTESGLLEPLRAELGGAWRVAAGGTADKFTSTLKALTGGFWLAIGLSYLLLVSLFRSWFSPLVILVTVPLALSGGLLGVGLATRWSPDASYDLLAMLGFVILAGIVVNNAILILHQTNHLRDAGIERRSALAEGARSRLRPILMSVTTSVSGMLPLAVGRGSGAELYQGLAAVVVGGLVVSTVFTLFLVPALLAFGWDLHDLLRRASGRGALESPAAGGAEPAPGIES